MSSDLYSNPEYSPLKSASYDDDVNRLSLEEVNRELDVNSIMTYEISQ